MLIIFSASLQLPISVSFRRYESLFLRFIVWALVAHFRITNLVGIKENDVVTMHQVRQLSRCLTSSSPCIDDYFLSRVT